MGSSSRGSVSHSGQWQLKAGHVPPVKGAGKELFLVNARSWTPAQGSACPRASQPLSCAPGITKDTKVKKGEQRALLPCAHP